MSKRCEKNVKIGFMRRNFSDIQVNISPSKNDTNYKGVRKMLNRISLILVIIGAINWGSIGLFKFDIVGWICGGQGSIVARIIYTLVALAGIWCISLFFRENTLLETNEHNAKDTK